MEKDLPIPLAPLAEQEASGIKQALATFSLSSLLGAGALVFLEPTTHTCGASRSAQLRRPEFMVQLEEAEDSTEVPRTSALASPPKSPSCGSPGSTPSR